LIGLLVGLCGVAVLVGFDAGTDPLALLGAGLILLAGACYSAATLLIKRPLYAELPRLGVVTVECAAATVVLAPLALTRLPAHLPDVTVLASLVLLGVVCTALAWLTFFALVAEVGASRATVFTYVNPAVAVLLGVTLLGEPLGLATGAGFLLIVAGCWLSTGGGLPRPLDARLGRARPSVE
jgi:drug/metabolite transporter (DMT)-like permease